MKLEVLVSTMYQKDTSLIKRMNIQSNAIIINQTCEEGINKLQMDNKNIQIYSYYERGLSKSRNRAVQMSTADICVIADDDVVYKDNYEDIILKAYEKYPDADIIAFDVPSTNQERVTNSLKEGSVDFLHSMKLASFQLTFRRRPIIDHKITFNEFFGAGAVYKCGEENIFLAECIKKGLKIKYVPQEIGGVNHHESTWYKGFDENLFKTKGAMFYEMSKPLCSILIAQFIIRKWPKYKNEVRFWEAYKYAMEGLAEYRKLKDVRK